MKQKDEQNKKKQSCRTRKVCLACKVEKHGTDFPKTHSRRRRNVCSACLMSMTHLDNIPFIEAYLKRKAAVVITDIEDSEERKVCIKRTVMKLKKMVSEVSKKKWKMQ